MRRAPTLSVATTLAALSVLLAAVPAPDAWAGDRSGEPAEEPADDSDDPDEVRGRQPAGVDDPTVPAATRMRPRMWCRGSRPGAGSRRCRSSAGE